MLFCYYPDVNPSISGLTHLCIYLAGKCWNNAMFLSFINGHSIVTRMKLAEHSIYRRPGHRRRGDESVLHNLANDVPECLSQLSHWVWEQTMINRRAKRAQPLLRQTGEEWDSTLPAITEKKNIWKENLTCQSRWLTAEDGRAAGKRGRERGADVVALSHWLFSCTLHCVASGKGRVTSYWWCLCK